MKKFLLLTICMLSSACVTTDQTWVRDYDGNQLNISSGTTGETDRFIKVTNTNRNWVGKYKGGEEAVPMRKAFLKELGEQEAALVCKGSNVKTDEGYEPGYEMLDTSPGVFGGGLLGYAIAAAASDYENLPTAMYYHFECTNAPVLNQSVVETKTTTTTVTETPQGTVEKTVTIEKEVPVQAPVVPERKPEAAMNAAPPLAEAPKTETKSKWIKYEYPGQN